LGSNIFYFSIWALFIAIGTKKTLKIQKQKQKKKKKKKQMSIKNVIVLIKAQKAQKRKPNFEKVVSGRLPILLIANR
jgi:hypothetical protein